MIKYFLKASAKTNTKHDYVSTIGVQIKKMNAGKTLKMSTLKFKANFIDIMESTRFIVLCFFYFCHN